MTGNIEFPDDWEEYLIDLENELPDLPEEKCSCEIRTVVNFGCKCEAGKAELKKERAT